MSTTGIIGRSPTGAPRQFNPPVAYRGDRYAGWSAYHPAPPAESLASARMQFRLTPTHPDIQLELTTADGSIIIDDAAGWRITVPPFTPSLAAGAYVYDVEFVDSLDRTFTLLGGTWRVQQDTTR